MRTTTARDEPGVALTTPPIVDALGTFCPVPVQVLHTYLRRHPHVETVELLADDPLAAVDVPAWCHAHQVEVVTMARDASGGLRMTLRRSIDRPSFAPCDDR